MHVSVFCSETLSLSAYAHRRSAALAQARMEDGAAAWAGAAVAAPSGGGQTTNISRTASIMTCALSTTPASIGGGPRMKKAETIRGGTGTIAAGSGGRPWTTILAQSFDSHSELARGSRARLSATKGGARE